MRRLSWALILSLSVLGCSRAAPSDPDTDKQQVLRIFESIDKQTDGFDEHWAAVDDDIVYQAPGQPTVEGKDAYKQQASDFFTGGSLEIRHELVELQSYADVVIARGRASGRFQPPGDDQIYPWKTRNLFVFRRSQSGELRISQIMVNTDPE